VYSTIHSTQREFFSILAEFFERATGSSYSDFSALRDFDKQIRQNAERLAERGPEADIWGRVSLSGFYQRHGMDLFGASKELGGIKLVLGGGRFTAAHVDSIRKMLLYADTILTPDPVLPWIESERAEERFRHVLLLQTVFTLLHLKPLVDSDLPIPAVLVFPSWEKSLEEKDDVTKSATSKLVTEFVSFYLGKNFEDEDLLMDYLANNESEFLRVAEEKQLLVAPEGVTGEPIRSAIDNYKTNIRTWRALK
jgi:hypothetical protein